jgi:hypothetical protein
VDAYTTVPASRSPPQHATNPRVGDPVSLAFSIGLTSGRASGAWSILKGEMLTHRSGFAFRSPSHGLFSGRACDAWSNGTIGPRLATLGIIAGLMFSGPYKAFFWRFQEMALGSSTELRINMAMKHCFLCRPYRARFFVDAYPTVPASRSPPQHATTPRVGDPVSLAFTVG